MRHRSSLASQPRTSRRPRAFTLIELLAVIVVVAVLVGVAMPKYFDYRAAAKSSAEGAIVAGVRAGVSGSMLSTASGGAAPTWPGSLDSAPVGSTASPSTPFFTVVLTEPITADWTKHASWSGTYTGLTGRRFTYDPADGTFAVRLDLTGNGLVDAGDTSFVAALFGLTVPTGDPNDDAADVNADGVINILDLSLVASMFGKTYP